VLSLLRPFSVSLWRVAGVRPEVAVRKCATATIVRRTAVCWAQMVPPAGPTKAARTQSCADENAQISDVTPAPSRMHQVSAFTAVSSSVVQIATMQVASRALIVASSASCTWLFQAVRVLGLKDHRQPEGKSFIGDERRRWRHRIERCSMSSAAASNEGSPDPLTMCFEIM
jgi:hypothetical protein